MTEEKKAIECPSCHEKEPTYLVPFHYGFKGSSGIECETCGREFSREQGEKAAQTSANVARVLRGEG